MFIDTHCHLDNEYFPDGLDRMLQTAADSNVRRMLYVGCNMESSLDSVAKAARYNEIFSAVGLHPEDIMQMADGISAELRALAKKPKVVAIGEIGIDYYWETKTREIQCALFAEQLKWAKEENLPAVVHIRDAKDKAEGDAMADVLRILRQCGSEQGIIHCFSGNYKDACAALELGFYISFSGIITFKNSAELREIAEKLPTDRLLCETDSPYLAPVPYRGKSNQPAYVAEVYKCLADIKNMKIEAFAEIIEENCRNLFRW